MARRDGQLVLSVLGAPVVVPIRGCLHPVVRPGPCKHAVGKAAPRAVARKPAPAAPGRGWLAGLTAAGVQDAVQSRHPGVQVDVAPTSAGDLHLHLIRVGDGRGQGKAQAAMKDLTAAADHLRRRITLTPEPLPGDTKTKKTRLIAWYKSHGFVQNKGRHQDLEISADMYRLPQPPALAACARVQACRPPHVPTPKPGPCKGFKVPPAARKVKKKPFTITGGPQLMSARDFERKVPRARRLYRGVGSAAGAAATRSGQLGGGDYGAGIYTDASIGTAQGYAGRLHDGAVMRMALKPGAKVRVIPPGVSGSRRISDWADENGVDVMRTSVGGYRIVRNPAVLMIDERDYTVRESVVLDYLYHGWTIPAGYEPEIAALRRDLGIEIPDAEAAR